MPRLMDTDHELIRKCLNRDLAAQKTFYTRLAPKMYALCRHFARNGTEAEDILQSGFLRVFNSLPQYRFEGSLEGWVRRIIVNAAINFNKRQLNINHEINIELMISENTVFENAESKLSEKDIMEVIHSLPYGHLMVFSLHEIEGYLHREIGVMLGISEGTSKSQLHRAKASIRRKMENLGMSSC